MILCVYGLKPNLQMSLKKMVKDDATKEVVVTEETTEDKAIIKTKHTGLYNIISDYEYRFIKKETRWYLEAVDYVDSEGKYPSL